MANIKQLLRLNLEIEGLLKILIERDSADAKSLLCEKFSAYTELMHDLIDNPDDNTLADEAQKLAESVESDEQMIEVKDQEAQETQVVDQDDAAAAAIARGTEKMKAAATNTVATAFTINDKFYYTRQVFDGNEQDFNDTLNILSQMESYADAEEYLYDDLMLDSKAPDVASFMEILRLHMPQ